MKVNKLLSGFIYVIGFVLISVVLFLNLVLMSKISNGIDEKVSIKFLGILNTLLTIAMTIGYYYLVKLLSKLKVKKEKKPYYFFLVLIIYMFIQVFWIMCIDIKPVSDQNYTYEKAVYMYNGNTKKIIENNYLEYYPHQITLAYLWNIVFKIFRTTDYRIIQYLNALANTVTFFMIYKMTKLLETKYSVNSKKTIIVSLSFLALPLLSTFVYGDIIGICFSSISLYFIMKYVMNNKKYFAIVSALAMGLSCMARMNNFIITIAILIYLMIDLISKKYEKKELIWKICIIAIFTTTSILPFKIVQSTLTKKYELNENMKFSTIGRLAMGMMEGNRGNGWFNEEIFSPGLTDTEQAKTRYTYLIKDRLNYFASHPIDFVKFYIKKIASMWTENTYASLWYNQSFNNGNEITESAQQKDNIIQKFQDIIMMYQKTVIIYIFFSIILILLKNKHNIENEVILFILIFVGGFLFHVLWEAKSRYVIPYIVLLFPLVSINIKKVNKDSENLTNSTKDSIITNNKIK